MQLRYRLGSQQRAVANQAFVHLGIKLNSLVDQRVERGELVRQQAGVVFLAPGLEGAEDRGAQQAAQVLAHAKHHREADQITRVGDHPANGGQHSGRQEEGAAEAQQELAYHQLIRTGQVVGLAVQQRGNNHQRQRGDDWPRQFRRLDGETAGDNPADDTGENGPRQMRHLLVL